MQRARYERLYFLHPSRGCLGKWRAKYGGMDTSMIARLKELEAENSRLKKMYADERLKAMIVQEALTKKL